MPRRSLLVLLLLLLWLLEVLLLHLAELPLGPQKEFYPKKFGEILKPQLATCFICY
ncbi:hypothetical protein TRIUR3_24119 [Triticum urartu]|uniref:Uncharacterized protein n=1 Tax=Triticum urartu TaxID=4572 RepID=M7ZFG5_TRIUA|nr:hypothetical protein TRIUR3_24119 [Triticum urartu]